MIVVAVACAILGDTVGFELGRRFGPPLRRSRAGLRVGEHQRDAVRGERAQDPHGEAARA